jgi:hypothetical protein
VTSPYPRAVLLVMVNHRKRLRIVDDDQIVTVQVISDRVFIDDFFVNPHFSMAQVDLPTLQGIVHLLGDAEEISCPLNHPPACPNPYTVHEESEGGQKLRYPAAIIG